MNPIIIPSIVFAAIALAMLAACGFLLWQQRAHYESLLAGLRDDNRDLRDRMFIAKGQPPTGTDMRAHEQERQQARVTRRRDTPKSAPDPTAHLKNTLASQEKRPATTS